MKIIAIANAAGSVGKTTTAVNLAAALAERGQRVVVADLDAQANATSWLAGYDALEATPQLGDALVGRATLTEALIKETAAPGVALLPTSKALIGHQRELEAGSPSKLPWRLVDALEAVSLDADIMIVDCPAGVRTMTLIAFMASDFVLHVLEPAAKEVEDLPSVFEEVSLARRSNPRLATLGILLTRVRRQTNHTGYETWLREEYGDLVFTTKIASRAVAQQAYGAQLPLTVYASQGPSASEHRALAGEVLDRLGL